MHERDPRPSMDDALNPNLSKSAKAKEAQTAKEREWRKRDSQRLAQLIRETREAMRADRERGR